MPKESGILHVMYGSRKYAHPHHRESLEILRGRRIFKGKYKPNVEFPEGWGFKPKKLVLELGKVWIFFGTTQFVPWIASGSIKLPETTK